MRHLHHHHCGGCSCTQPTGNGTASFLQFWRPSTAVTSLMNLGGMAVFAMHISMYDVCSLSIVVPEQIKLDRTVGD